MAMDLFWSRLCLRLLNNYKLIIYKTLIYLTMEIFIYYKFSMYLNLIKSSYNKRNNNRKLRSPFLE